MSKVSLSQKSIGALVLALALAASLFAMPATAQMPPDWQKSIRLEPMDPTMGPLPYYDGYCRIGSISQRQFFQLRIFSDAADGTVYSIGVRRQGALSDDDGWYLVGSVTIELGTGVLTIYQSNFSSPVFPVEDLAEVRVATAEALILHGSF